MKTPRNHDHHRRQPRPAAPRLLRQPAAARTSPRIGSRRLPPLADADELLSEVESSGLLGRGGAAFPLAVKLRAVRDNGRLARRRPSSSPTAKRESRLRSRTAGCCGNRPHLVLDGLRLAAAIVGADRAYVYVSDAESARSVEAALAELDAELWAASRSAW